MNLRLTMAALAAISVLAAAGCGSSSSSSTSTGAAASGGSSGNAGSGPAKTTASSNAVNPNAPDVTPPGDIPDNQVYIPYKPPGGGYTVKVPEGWSRASGGGSVTFSSNLNSIQMQSSAAGQAPTVAFAKKTIVPQLSHTVDGFAKPTISVVHRTAGPVLLITYYAWGKPNAVTGKKPPEKVERYVFFHKGKQVTLTLSGEKNADNVDPWRTVTDSLRWG